MKIETFKVNTSVWVKMMKPVRVLGLALGLCLVCLPLFSQLNTGRISGAVTDQSGGAIAGATVTVIDVARGESRPLTADGAGLYAAPNLTPGTYTVRVAFMGFQTVDRQNVVVGAGGDVRVDVTMQPGQQTQTVTVTESIPIVNTTNAQTGGTLAQDMIANLPTNGRNYRWLGEYVPGITIQGGEGSGQTSVNGGGVDWLEFMVDGVSDDALYTHDSTTNNAGGGGNATIIPLDAVQEVVLVTNPKAEYGWDPGATYNLALKSGTNNIHGSAFAFGRDQDLDAKNNFAAVRPPVSYEQWGGSLGGPIKKDKIFYFGGYESIRLNATSDFFLNSQVPSQSNQVTSTSLGIPAAIAGVEKAGLTPSQLSLNILGCGTAASYAGLITTASVPSCTVNPLGAGSLYNSTACSYVGSAATSTTTSCSFPQFGGTDNFLAKIDYHINDHHTLNGSYYFGRYNEYVDASTAMTQPYWDEIIFQRSQMVRGVEIWTPNSSWLNEIRVGWDHSTNPISTADCSKNGLTNDALGYSSSPGNYGSSNYLTAYGLDSGTGICGNPTIELSKLPNLGNTGGNANRVNLQSDSQGSDIASYTRGSHQFKFGVDARFPSFTGVTVNDTQEGIAKFGAAGAAAFTAATPLEDFIAGDPSSETLKLGNPVITVRWDMVGLFAQDDWRILPRLVLNLGLRWELQTPASEYASIYNHGVGLLGDFDPAEPSGMTQNNRIWSTQSDFSPHFGFVWDVTGKGTTTVRAGIGVGYVTPKFQDYISQQSTDMSGVPTGATLYYGNGVAEQTHGVNTVGNITNMLVSLTPITNGSIITNETLPWAANAPLYNTSQFQCGDGLPVVGGAGNNPSPCTGYAFANNYKLAYMTTWNLNVQHAFTNNLSLDIGYTGSHSGNITETVDLNQPTLNVPGQIAVASSTSNEQQRRPYFENCPVAQGGLGLNPSECFPWFAQILSTQEVGSEDYDALQASLNQRLAHGLTYTVGYTLSHDQGVYGGAGGSGANVVMNTNCPKCEYGPLSLDARNHFSLTATYNIPGRKSPGQMLEGWAINSTVNVMSGLPLAVDDTSDDFSGTGENLDRWTLYGPAKPFDQLIGGAGTIPCYGVTGSKFASSCIQVPVVGDMPAACIAGAQGEPTGPTGQTGLQQLAAVGCYMVNGSAMVPPALGTFGNMLRNELRGKGFSAWDASITKDWKFRERLNAQFRAEAFNVLNRTQYGMATANLNLASPASFGESTETPDVAHSNPVVGSGGPREIQLGLRLTF